MSTPKRHHYIPQMLLRAFANESGKIWYYNKKNPKLGVVEIGVDKIFFESDLHTHFSKDGSRDVSLELYFRDLENDTAPVLDKIRHSVRRNNIPSLSSEEKSLVDLFFLYQRKRSPDVLDSVLSPSEFSASLAHFVCEYETNVRALTSEERSTIFSERGANAIRKNARVQAIRHLGDELLGLVSNMGIGILNIEKDNKSLLIASNNFHKLTNRHGTRFGLPSVQCWMPIAPDIAISPMGRARIECIVKPPSDQWLRDLNRHIFRSSNSVGASSRQLIHSLLNDR